LNNEILKEIMLELNGKPSSVTTFSNDFSLQNLVLKKLFEFSGTKFTKNSIFPTS
jgi:rRNA maturation endonuclease Nob1